MRSESCEQAQHGVAFSGFQQRARACSDHGEQWHKGRGAGVRSRHDAQPHRLDCPQTSGVDPRLHGTCSVVCCRPSPHGAFERVSRQASDEFTEEFERARRISPSRLGANALDKRQLVALVRVEDSEADGTSAAKVVVKRALRDSQCCCKPIHADCLLTAASQRSSSGRDPLISRWHCVTPLFVTYHTVWYGSRVYPDPLWPVIVLAAISAFDAVISWKPVKFIADCLDGVRFPRRWWKFLPITKTAAALGLVAGIWLPWLGLVTTACLIAYFVVAISMHIRARDIGRNLFVNASGMLVICVAVLVFSFLV